MNVNDEVPGQAWLQPPLVGLGVPWKSPLGGFVAFVWIWAGYIDLQIFIQLATSCSGHIRNPS